VSISEEIAEAEFEEINAAVAPEGASNQNGCGKNRFSSPSNIRRDLTILGRDKQYGRRKSLARLLEQLLRR
jgi:hypothetical protein